MFSLRAGLKDCASDAVTRLIDERNVAAILEAADSLNAPKLKAACLTFMATHVDMLVCGVAERAAGTAP